MKNANGKWNIKFNPKSFNSRILAQTNVLKPQCECIYTYMEDTCHYTYSKDEMGKSGKPQCCAAIGDLLHK